MVEVDVGALTRRWQQAWGRCPPVGHLLRGYLRERWVRLHSLPRSKRYPTSEAEYATMLGRHNTVLGELGAAGVYLITMRYDLADPAAGTEPSTVGLQPGAVAWMRLPDLADPDLICDIYVSHTDYTAGSLDDLLRAVADDRASHVIIADEDLRWLYHPYDGGADVILPTTTERDRLKDRHRGWLSPHATGL